MEHLITTKNGTVKIADDMHQLGKCKLVKRWLVAHLALYTVYYCIALYKLGK